MVLTLVLNLMAGTASSSDEDKQLIDPADVVSTEAEQQDEEVPETENTESEADENEANE